ncbi:MAG: hypothetical protein A2W17_05025 [Planctomycetes bacterium RBG_16_41_13]|nr:MAG: hypothetical protein A2W17_05025 [Planctomycetes bacterium RBG_16_41_13]
MAEINVSLFKLVAGVSNALDLVNPLLVNHHKQVAYVASSIAEEMELPRDEQIKILLAGLLHDVGCISLKSRLDLLHPEIEETANHAEIGYHLIKSFEPFSKIAALIRYHDMPWNNRETRDEDIPLGSYILKLADAVVVRINKKKEILGQVVGICEEIRKLSGKTFMPELVKTFLHLSSYESFWFDVTLFSIDSALAKRARLAPIELNMEDIVCLSKLICHIIDFRSRFTATHTNGVAAAAVNLCRLLGFSEQEQQMMRIAGYLHDLGKLSVPAELLEKPASLSEDEFRVIKKHTYNTYRVLGTIPDLHSINEWASFHHERLDGNGYPFHRKDENLPLGAKILAVADVFTAITEDRPYRKGMSKDEVLKVLRKMVGSALDPLVVVTLEKHYDMICSMCKDAREEAFLEYVEFEKYLNGDRNNA